MLSGNGDKHTYRFNFAKSRRKGFLCALVGETTLRDAGVLAGIAAFVTKKLAL
jgi:hypothetical protein